MSHFLFLSQDKCHSLVTLPFNVVSLSLHSWKMQWQVLLKDRFLIQDKGCWFPSQTLIVAFFSCGPGSRGALGGGEGGAGVCCFVWLSQEWEKCGRIL